MRQFNLNYTRKDWGAKFIVPSSSIQTSHGIFEKATSYGYTLSLPFNLSSIHDKDTLLIKYENKTTKEISPNKQGLFIIYLGINIQRPQKTALYHIGLLDKTINFTIDQFYKEWYKVNLYIHIRNIPVKGAPFGEPAIQIIPIPDQEYQFIYGEITL